MALTQNEIDSAVNRFAASGDQVGFERYLTSKGATNSELIQGGMAFNRKVSSMNNNGNQSNKTLDFKGKLVDSIKATLSAQVSTSKTSELEDNEKIDYETGSKALKDKSQIVKLLGGQILQQIKNEEQLRTDINETLGVTGTLSEKIRDTIIESSSGALQFGFGIKNISDMFTTIAESSGRANFMSIDTVSKTYGVARAFVGSLSDVGRLIAEMEKIGLGASDSLTAVEKAGRSSLGLGLNTKKTTELLKKDLEKLNEYGFKNGVEGLNRMVQKSLEFRMNLGEVYKIAEKVMNPDGAIELTANLQVLGGAIGDFNDPLKLMYMATNNVEGLQDALIGAAGGLATFNQEQGRFEITGVNLRRAQEMAKQLGIEYKEFAKGAIAAQERLSVVQDLAGKGFGLSEKDTEFIANLSQMKDGKMVLSVPQDVADKIGVPIETAVTDLTQSQIEILKNNRKELEKMDSEEIARQQFSAVKNLDNNVTSILNRDIRGFATEGAKFAKDGAFVDSLNKLATRAAQASAMNNTKNTTGKKYFEDLKTDGNKLAKLMGMENLGEKGVELLRTKFETERNKILENNYKENRKEQELKTRPDERTSYNPNTILKTKIDVTFPFGYGGQPSAEQQGSYLVTV
jgi:hypothetical protein